MPRKELSPEEREARVLATFMVNGRVPRLPARHAKLMVVLRWLAELFRPAERYPERTVNEVLGRYHDDVASVRRLLVDEGLMQRQDNLYWRAGTMPFPRRAPYAWESNGPR
jgi:hypothetical protein